MLNEKLGKYKANIFVLNQNNFMKYILCAEHLIREIF